MYKLNPQKLYTRFFPGTTAYYPIKSRHYTLTHSDKSGNLFLSIALTYMNTQITPNRDEVLAKWSKDAASFGVYIHVDSEPVKTFADSERRLAIFKRELPLALEAIRFGDRKLFCMYPHLDCADILVYFKSTYPALTKTERWGKLADYR